MPAGKPFVGANASVMATSSLLVGSLSPLEPICRLRPPLLTSAFSPIQTSVHLLQVHKTPPAPPPPPPSPKKKMSFRPFRQRTNFDYRITQLPWHHTHRRQYNHQSCCTTLPLLTPLPPSSLPVGPCIYSDAATVRICTNISHKCR